MLPHAARVVAVAANTESRLVVDVRHVADLPIARQSLYAVNGEFFEVGSRDLAEARRAAERFQGVLVEDANEVIIPGVQSVELLSFAEQDGLFAFLPGEVPDAVRADAATLFRSPLGPIGFVVIRISF